MRTETQPKLFAPGVVHMDFVKAGDPPPLPAPTQSPEPSALPHWTQFPESEVWGCMYWFGKRDPIIRPWRIFAAHFSTPPVKGLCYELDGRPVRCIRVDPGTNGGGGMVTFEEAQGNVGGGMDRIVELAY